MQRRQAMLIITSMSKIFIYTIEWGSSISRRAVRWWGKVEVGGERVRVNLNRSCKAYQEWMNIVASAYLRAYVSMHWSACMTILGVLSICGQLPCSAFTFRICVCLYGFWHKVLQEAKKARSRGFGGPFLRLGRILQRLSFKQKKRIILQHSQVATTTSSIVWPQYQCRSVEKYNRDDWADPGSAFMMSAMSATTIILQVLVEASLWNQPNLVPLASYSTLYR